MSDLTWFWVEVLLVAIAGTGVHSIFVALVATSLIRSLAAGKGE